LTLINADFGASFSQKLAKKNEDLHKPEPRKRDSKPEPKRKNKPRDAKRAKLSQSQEIYVVLCVLRVSYVEVFTLFLHKIE